MKRLEALVTGRVQGVSFRYATQRQARQQGLNGWVRNEPDGSVRVVAEGSEQKLERLLSFLRQGPPMAVVADVAVNWGEPSGNLTGFQIRYR